MQHSSPNTAPNTARAHETPKKKFRALPPQLAALSEMRALNGEQRRERAVRAAADGDCCRIDALAAVGFEDWDASLDEYGQRAIIIAAAAGHVGAVRALLRPPPSGLHELP